MAAKTNQRFEVVFSLVFAIVSQRDEDVFGPHTLKNTFVCFMLSLVVGKETESRDLSMLSPCWVTEPHLQPLLGLCISSFLKHCP